MAFDTLLAHTCSILERTRTGTDDSNQPIYTWSVVQSSWDCRFQRFLREEVEQSLSHTTIQADYLVFGREPNVTLNETDYRLRWNGDDYKIERVDPETDFGAKHHIEVFVSKIKKRNV